MVKKSIPSFLLSLALFLLFVWGLNHLTELGLIMVFLLMMAFSYNGVRLLGRAYPDKETKIVRLFLGWCFLFYLFILFQLTFNIFRPTSQFIFSNKEDMKMYFMYRTNFVPFKSIVEPFKYGMSARYIIINIFGNILALMPIGFFGPLFIKPMRKVVPFLIGATLVVAFIEGVQMILLVGAMDIDDFILNVFGAFLMFLILKVPFIHRIVLKVFPGIEY